MRKGLLNLKVFFIFSFVFCSLVNAIREPKIQTIKCYCGEIAEKNGKRTERATDEVEVRGYLLKGRLYEYKPYFDEDRNTYVWDIKSSEDLSDKCKKECEKINLKFVGIYG